METYNVKTPGDTILSWYYSVIQYYSAGLKQEFLKNMLYKISHDSYALWLTHVNKSDIHVYFGTERSEQVSKHRTNDGYSLHTAWNDINLSFEPWWNCSLKASNITNNVLTTGRQNN